MTSRCPRSFEAEALRDGRLSGPERTSFERHLASCADCSRETRALERLSEALRASYPSSTDELHVRRERLRLLAAFSREPVAPARRPTARRAVLGLGAVAAIAACFALWRLDLASSPAATSKVIVHSEGAALWSRRTDDGRERIVLERGELRIRVAAAPGQRALVVELPDGELEDTGTTFSVTVEAGRTVRVAVEEGSVLLRLRDRAPVAVGAGQTWTAAPPPATTASARTTERAPSAEPALSAEPVEPARPAQPPRNAARPEPEPNPDRGSSLRDATSDEFRAAVEALGAGKSREAADRFSRFLERHPRDRRAEDAAYLRVLALSQSGDRAAMQSAASDYLRRYPSGFRRTEVEKLAASVTRSQ